MTISEAWKIIEACKGWNTSQEGFTAAENEIFVQKRAALAKAWWVITHS